MKAMMFTLAIAAGIATTAAAKEPPFLAKAIQGDMAEVKMGELAQQNGASQPVKDYGQMLVTDHGAHRDKAIEMAKAMKMTPPTEPDAKAKADYAKLSAMKGKAFDAAFKQHMIMDHKKDIAEYKKESMAKDAKLAAFAKETVPTLEKHLAAAEKL